LSDSRALAIEQSADSHFPVGVFDSGIGGLSVLQHIRQRLPNESLLYFADSGFAPYGEKSEAEIIERSLTIAAFLLEQNIKALVVACNTATAAAVATLRQKYPDLIIVGIEPGLKPAALKSMSKIVGVLATKSTLQSQKFKHLSDQLSLETGVQFIPQACIGLVNQIEKGELHSAETMQLVRSYVAPLLAKGTDILVLGCTHYPFVKHLIKQVVDENSGAINVQLIDTGEAVSKQLHRLLEQNHLLNLDSTKCGTTIQTWTSGSTISVQHAFTRILGLPDEQFKVTAIT
jgi:glutamate racemase